MQTLADGLVCRRATADLAAQAADLNGLRNGPPAGDCCHRVLQTYGPDIFWVVVDGDRVVSTVCLLRETFVLDGVEFPVGRPEFVCTDEQYGGRGLIRRQLDEIHEACKARGDIMEIILGIPYFYRQFGYEYAIEMARARTVPATTTITAPDGYALRPAQDGDYGDILRLQRAECSRSALVCTPSETEWRAPSFFKPVVAEFGGRVVGFARSFFDENSKISRMDAVAVADPRAAVALLADALSKGSVVFSDRPGSVFSRVAEPFFTSSENAGPLLYVRIVDPVRFLDHVKPALTRRLRESAFAGYTGELLISFYRRAAKLHITDGEVASVVPAACSQRPWDEGGIAVPPDLAATFILGRHGAAELNERHADVMLQAQPVMSQVLFPKVSSDVLLFL